MGTIEPVSIRWGRQHLGNRIRIMTNEARPMPSTFVLPAPQRNLRLLLGMARSARPSALWGAVVLCTAILLAALGTTDPLWWHLHFSRLGMFADLSGHTFNLGVVLSGLVIAAAGVPLAVHLASAMAAGRCADPRAARLLPPLMVALGASLAMIGVVPLTLNEFLHDRAANGVLLSFLGLVVVSRRMLPELPPLLLRSAIVAVVLLSVGIALMITSVINLAAFEVVAFGSVLTWVHLLERSVRRLGAQPAHLPDQDDADIAVPEAAARPGRADSVRRGTARRVPASLTRTGSARRAPRGTVAHRMMRGRGMTRGRARPALRPSRVARGHTPPSIDRL